MTNFPCLFQGKGKCPTYWLEGEDDPPPLPDGGSVSPLYPPQPSASVPQITTTQEDECPPPPSSVTAAMAAAATAAEPAAEPAADEAEEKQKRRVTAHFADEEDEGLRNGSVDFEDEVPRKQGAKPKVRVGYRTSSSY